MHSREGTPGCPHGQGFMAATSMNSAGNSKEALSAGAHSAGLGEERIREARKWIAATGGLRQLNGSTLVTVNR